MEFVELKKHIKSQKPSACYVCYGDDMFLLDRAASIIGALAGEPKIFNLTDKQFDGAKQLTDELMQLPVMSEYRVVVSRGKPDESMFSAVSDYLNKPNPTTVLVLVYYTPHDSWGRAGAIKLPSGSVPVVCNRLAVTHVYAFARAVAQNNGATVDDGAVRALYDRCGGYMTRIDTEMKKLATLKTGGVVTAADVAAHVQADAEFVVFELCDSILANNAARALEVVDGMAKTNDLVAAFTLIYNRFRRLFAAAVDPDGLADLGVKPYMAGKLKQEAARFSKLRLKKVLDMLEKADHSYKTGAMTVYDALVGFVAQASYSGK